MANNGRGAQVQPLPAGRGRVNCIERRQARVSHAAAGKRVCVKVVRKAGWKRVRAPVETSGQMPTRLAYLFISSLRVEETCSSELVRRTAHRLTRRARIRPLGRFGRSALASSARGARSDVTRRASSRRRLAAQQVTAGQLILPMLLGQPGRPA